MHVSPARDDKVVYPATNEQVGVFIYLADITGVQVASSQGLLGKSGVPMVA